MALVTDIRAYPEFIPWITSLRVWNEGELEPGVTTRDAEVVVGFSMLSERFSTRVRTDANACRVDMDLISGPFRRLKGQWTFEETPTGSRMRLEVDFEFKSRLLDMMARANLDRAVGKLVTAFESRAMGLYQPLAPAAR